MALTATRQQVHCTSEVRCGSDSVIRRRRLNVRFAGKRTRLSDLPVRALISATAPPLRSVARPRPRRSAESEPLAASRRSPIPATASIAEEARGRRGPRRGRSSALARSIGLDQPKKRGRGADQFSGASHKIACAPALDPSNLQSNRPRSRGDVLEVSTIRGQKGRRGVRRGRPSIRSVRGGVGPRSEGVAKARGATLGRVPALRGYSTPLPGSTSACRRAAYATIEEPKRPISLAIFVEFRPSPRKDRWDR